MDTLLRRETRTCETCEGPLPDQPKGGRPLLYCSPECRPSGWPEEYAEYARSTFERVDVSWQASATCADHPNPEVFFPKRGQSSKAAREVCARCPVKSECLEFALHTLDLYGVWGGTTERERRALRRERGMLKREPKRIQGDRRHAAGQVA